MAKDVSADGLRGLAAANVVLCHLLISVYPLGFRYLWPSAGLASLGLSAADRVISLPFLSILWNGNFPVCIFFVLSGYVLSAKFSATGNVSALSTMALRRFFRLAVPVFGCVLFAYAVMSFGCSAWRDAAAITGSTWLGHFWAFAPDAGNAIRDGAYRAILAGSSPYVPVLWTMKIELIGSFLVFGYATLCPRGSLALPFFATAAIALWIAAPGPWPFYMGFLAGVHIGRISPVQPKYHVAIALVGAVLFGGFDYSPMYAWAAGLSPDADWNKNFFNILGGICTVYAVRAGFGTRLLSSSPVQYMGRISYSLYLVHFPLVLTLYSGILVVASRHGWTRGAAMAVAMPVTIAAACAVSSMFQRTFDRWGIALSHRLFPEQSEVGPRW